MTLTKKEINKMWKEVGKGKYYDNDELIKNNYSTKGLKLKELLNLK